MFSNEVRIETSTYCAYKCSFCPHHTSAFTRKKQFMSLELYKDLLSKVKDQVPQITDCTISGFGEAFIDPTLIDKIWFARSLDYNVHVLTTGSELKKTDVDKLINLGVVDIRFSLHTTNQEYYKKITGRDTHSKVLDIIQYAYQCSRFTDTKIVVTGEIIDINEDDVENLKHFQYADEIELWRPHNWASWGEYRSGDIVKTTCGRPFNGPLQIQVDGTVNMCCFDFNGDLEIGDLKTQTIEEIFTSDAYMEIYNHHKNGTVTESNLLCKNCDQLKDSGSVLVYSTKGDDRVGKLSTTYKSLD